MVESVKDGEVEEDHFRTHKKLITSKLNNNSRLAKLFLRG